MASMADTPTSLKQNKTESKMPETHTVVIQNGASLSSLDLLTFEELEPTK